MISLDNCKKNPFEFIQMFLLVYVAGALLSISLSQVGIFMALMMAGYYLVKIKSPVQLKTPLSLPIGIFLGITLLSVPFAFNVSTSLSYIPNYWTFLVFFLIYYFFESQRYPQYLEILAVVAIITACYSIMQYFWGISLLPGRVGVLNDAVGFYGNHLTFGGVLVQVAALLIAAVMVRGSSFSSKERYLYWTSLAFVLLSWVLCNARSSWIGLVVAGVVIISLYNYKILAYVAPVALVLFLAAYIAMPFFKMRVTSIVQYRQDGSAMTRVHLWSAAVKIIRAHPLIGIGDNNFDTLAEDPSTPYYEESLLGTGLGTPHNAYLTLAVTRGIPGMLVYLWIWLSFFKIAVSGYLRAEEESWQKALLLGAIGAAVAFLVSGIFETNYADEEVMMFMLFIVGMAMAVTVPPRLVLLEEGAGAA